MFKHIINKFLNDYGYDNISQFAMSLCPSSRYQLLPQSLTVSTIGGAVCSLIGVWPVVALAMVVILLLEMATGLTASHISKAPFESCKFARFSIKLAVWFILLISCQLFAFFCTHYHAGNIIFTIGSTFFDALTVMIMIWFTIEYFSSILENFAVINRKPKPYYIDSIRELGFAAFAAIKNTIVK